MVVVLPPKLSDEGAVCRLLLAEVQGPAFSSYTVVDALKCMQWMKVVVANRLAHHPGEFNAKGGKSLIDIIKAPGQFAGFQAYPHYDKSIFQKIQQAIDIANAKNDSRSAAYTLYVTNAINVAKNQPIDDPCATGLYGWKTLNSASPKGRFISYQTLKGITFYTLTSAD